MERVATIAQLTGVDVLGLILTIVQAAQTVHRNKETCQELVQEVQLIRDLLRMLQDPEMMCREEIVNALSGLKGTLKEAYTLVTSCSDCSAMYRFFMGWKQADQFRRIKKKIAKHLRLYPMISHADLTCRLEKLANSAALSTCSFQDAQEMLASPSSTSHSNSEARAQGSLEITDELQKGQVVTQSINNEEHHQTGNQDAAQTLSARKSRSWWNDLLSSKKAASAAKTHMEGARAVKFFTFAELMVATKDFALDRKIGQSKRVYMGMLADGREVAIKRMLGDTKEFMAARTILTTLHHKHIVHLIGCCVVEEERRLSFRKKEEHLLVFEYTKNGSLSDHLHGPLSSSSSPVAFSWKTRIEILLGVSQAIDYLHSYAVPPVIHCDINTSNILLDSSLAPRLSGFGLAVTGDEAESNSCIRGTYGYIAPEYAYTCTINPTYDVYSFGVVMLEVLAGKKPIFHWKEEDNHLEDEHGDSHMDLVNAVLRLINAGKLRKILDKRLVAEPTPGQLEALDLVARMAAHCLQEKGEDRPAMLDVLTKLQAALELLRCDEQHGLGVTDA